MTNVQAALIAAATLAAANASTETMSSVKELALNFAKFLNDLEGVDVEDLACPACAGIGELDASTAAMLRVERRCSACGGAGR